MASENGKMRESEKKASAVAQLGRECCENFTASKLLIANLPKPLALAHYLR